MKALQKKWYSKLRQTGFTDIEDPKGNLYTRISTWFIRDHGQTTRHEDTFDNQREYYRRCGLFLHQHSFATELEYKIWDMHTEGMSRREISAALILMNRRKKTGLSTNVVHRTIVRLEQIMETYFLNGDD